MTDQTPALCSMFGVFNLQKSVDLAGFKISFDAFGAHLKQAGFVQDWRVLQRSAHDGYDADFPDLSVMVEVRFNDRAAADAGWAYVEAAEDPLHSLHLAVNLSIKDSMFVLFEAV